MAFKLCCSCTPFDYVNLKAFSSDDGSWQWEKKALRVMVSHNGTVRLYRQREVSGWTNSTLSAFGSDAGLGIVPLRPNTTVNNQWTTRTATNIDDAITEPSGTGDGLICQAVGPTDNGKEQQWSVSGTYTAGSNVIAAVSIWILAKKTEDTQPSSISAVKFRTNGTWHTAASVPTLTTSYAWHRIDIENTTITPWTLSTSSPAVALTAVVTDASASIDVEAIYVDALCTIGSGGFSYPTGTAPTARYKQWSVDSVTVAADGSETINATDCLFFEVERTIANRGLPIDTSIALAQLAVPLANSPGLRALQCSDAGLVIDQVSPKLQIFDVWKRSTVKKYRICLGWLPNTGSPLQLVFRRFATSATVTHEDTAATIETALESIDGVVSATVTGGPLFVKHVDIEIEWEAATDQFHGVHILNLATESPMPWAIINIDDYEVVGYDYTASAYGWHWASDSSEDIILTTRGTISSVEWLFVTRIAQETDGDGWLYYDNDLVWSSKITTVTIEQANGNTLARQVVSYVYDGIVVGTHNRRNFASSSDVFNYWVLDESDGTGLPDGTPFDFYANGTGLTGHTSITSMYLADNGKHVFQGTKSGVNDPILWEMPSTPNELSPDRDLLYGVSQPARSGDDYIWSGRSPHGTIASLVDLQLTSGYGGSTTLQTGGDAFFPTHTYNRRTVIFFGSGTRYRGATLEFRFTLGQVSGGTWVSSGTSDWLAYDASDVEVEAALNAIRGDTSASTPSITVSFAASAADDEDLAWFYRGATVVICMQRNGVATDITDDNLIEFGATLRIEIRNANVEKFLQIAKENFDDGIVLWQRDVGKPALTTALAAASTVAVGDNLLSGIGWWKPLPIDETSGLPVEDTTIFGALP